MPSMRFIENEEKFLEYAWNVFASYFRDKSSFIGQYNQINSPENKNRFLRLANYYLFFVSEGSYSSPKYQAEDLSFVDQTYKFVAIVALIESMYGKSDFIDFYQWIMKNRNNDVFPINKPIDLDKLYASYKEQHGSTLNIIKFFQSLDDSAKLFIQHSLMVLDDSGKTGELEEKEESIETLAKLLYQIRSEYVHRAELILEFDPATVLSVRGRKPLASYIELKHICLIFESGLLKYFGFIPDNKHI